MSLLDTQGPAFPDAVDDTDGPPTDYRRPVVAMSSPKEGQEALAVSKDLQNLDPHTDARAIVRLVQCQRCSLPLRTPLTLPCGHSICRPCLPELHERENISYPMIASRKEGFRCPIRDCDRDHALGDCSQDVTLAKVLERVSNEIARYRPIASDTPTLLDERPHWKNVVDSLKVEDQPRSRILSGGRLVATYTMAELGELRYDSEISYQTMSKTGDDYQHLDAAMLIHLKEVARTELDCQVCYALMLDPLTTPCGHTFCRNCVSRALDHSNLCPICRRTLHMPPDISRLPCNRTLSNLLTGLCPDLVAARIEASKEEHHRSIDEGKDVPIFVCTLAFPSMPTFLHVFEPRYRLMMRRAVDSGDRKFGMVMYNQSGEPQGDLGHTSFLQYGTLLHIVNMHLLPDGRSLIETVGVSRFKIKSHGMKDGYLVGNIERVDDISLADEEAIEATERSSSWPAEDGPPPLHTMATEDLFQVSKDFIMAMRERSAPWLQENVAASYGPPPEDPAVFPYWFASILPIAEHEKYKLLAITSVRGRLKVIVHWVRRIEAQRWSSNSSCSIA